jgi:hypothetical protein
MAAECFWCSSENADPQYPPLGTCSDCWVFACGDYPHAERSKALGKWKCFDGVAKLVAAGAGLEDAEDLDEPPIADPDQLAARFPVITAVTADSRRHWSERSDELMAAARRTAPDRIPYMERDEQRAREMLAHATGIIDHFLPIGVHAEAAGPGPSGRLGQLVQEL